MENNSPKFIFEDNSQDCLNVEGESEANNIIIEVVDLDSTVEISSDDHIYQNEGELANEEVNDSIQDNHILNSDDDCDSNIIDKNDADSNSGVKESLSDIEYEEDISEDRPISHVKGKKCLKHVICIGGKSAVREIEDDDNSMSMAENCIYTKQSIIISEENYVFSEEGSSSILKHDDLNEENDTDNDEDNIQNDDDESKEYIFDTSTDFNIVINEEVNNEDKEEEIDEIYTLDDNVASNVNISLKDSILFKSNVEYEEEIDVVSEPPLFVRDNKKICEPLANCHSGRRKFRYNTIDDEDDEDSEHADHIYGKGCGVCHKSINSSGTCHVSSIPVELEYIEEDEVKDLNNEEEAPENDEDNEEESDVNDVENDVDNDVENDVENDIDNDEDNDEESDNELNLDNEIDDELVMSMRRANKAADEEIRNIMSNRKRSLVDDIVYNRTDREEILPKVLVVKNEEGGHYCKRIGTYKPTYVQGLEYREEFNVKPGCSKDDDYTDSNTTIKNMIRSKPRPLGRNQFSPENDDYSDDSDDSDYSYQCLCVSPHEDDDYCEDDDEELDEREWNRIWRKRKYDGASTPTPPQCKKFCPDGSIASVPADGSLLPSAANITGPPNVNQWLNKFLGWSKNEKIQAIDALINCCAASQVRHMMKTIEPLLQRDFISLLPKELALTVLGYLKPKDLLIAAQTCRYWRFLADDNLLWKEQCRRIGIMALKKSTRYIPRCANPWKAAYMKQYLIENNWLHKSVKTPLVLRGHDDHVITCLQFYGNRILSGSDDTTLKIWSAVTGKCLRTLVGHAGGVWSSQMVGNMVVSGSTDRTLRVWEANTGKCLNILIGHTSTVRCLHLHQDKVVSGSRDATLRIWSLKDGKCLRVLIGHLAAVRCVQYNGKVVVSGAYDFYVKVWNPETGECIHTLAGHTNRVYSLQFDGIHIVSGSLDTSIKVWDVETGQLKHTLVGHQSLTSGMELHSNILVSGNADSTVKVWDISTGHCLHTLSGPSKHQSAVTCLQSTNRFVITSSDDGTVKLWDMRTGEFIRNLVELNSGGSGGVVWRIRASATKLICAVGSRNGTEETKLLVLDFDTPGVCRKCEE